MILAQIGGDISFSSSSVNGDLSIPSSTLMGDITITGETCEIYRGPYEFTPKTEEQIISIENKKAKEDITIEEIPYFESDNIFGGKTVSIAFV